MFALFVFSAPFDVSAAVIQRPPNNLDLVAYYPMDEGRGNSVGDMSGSGNDGTMQGDPQWTDGKSGDALEFDGSDDEITVPQNFRSTFQNKDFTVSMWVRFDTPSESRFFGLEDGGGSPAGDGDKWVHFIARNETWRASFDDGTNKVRINAGDVVSKKWYQFTVVHKEGDDYEMFVDGTSLGSVSDNGDFTESNHELYFGSNGRDGWHDGEIDDVRIYSRALTASEVEDLYETGSDRVTRNTTNTDRFTDGLVGHWTFDGKDTDISGGTTNDVSGNGNHGTLNGDPQQAYGRVGQALEFDGLDDYVEGSGFTNLGVKDKPYSISTWVRVAAGESKGDIIGSSENPFSQDSGWRIPLLKLASGTFRAFSWQDSGVSKANSNITAESGTWYHLVTTWDPSGLRIYVNGALEGSSDQSDFNASGGTNYVQVGRANGTGSTDPFHGNIDGVRVYDYALSSDEIKALYTATKPQHENVTRDNSENSLSDGLVGHWTFDGPDVDGTTASDTSGNSNDGTFQGDPEPGFGNIGQALKFDGGVDGDDDYLTTSSGILGDSSNVTVSAWLYDDATGRQGTWTGIYDVNNSGAFLVYHNYSGEAIRFRTGNGSSNDAVDTSDGTAPNHEWIHVVARLKNDTERAIFINGEKKKADTSAYAFSEGGNVHEIGINKNYPLGGRLDDVRIYNRALSESEIQRLYNMGR